MGRFDVGEAVRVIRAGLGESPRVRVALDPEVARYLDELRAEELGRLPTDVHGRPHVGGEVDGWPRGTSAWGSPDRFAGVDATPPRSPDFSLGSDDWMGMSRSADANSPGRLRQRSNPIPGGRRGDPNPAGDLKRIAAQNIDEARVASEAARNPSSGMRAAQAAGAAGAAAGLGLMVTPTPLTESGNPADLRDDPVPAGRDFIDDTLMGMDADDLMQPIAEPKPPEPVTPPAPVDYSLEARKLIDQLNAMRRKAGGEVREAPAMMREINRLLAMGDKQRNTPGYKIPQADPARDPYQQARDLIDQVNAMYRQGARPGDPRIQQMMAKVRQLQAQGDAIRNRGTR